MHVIAVIIIAFIMFPMLGNSSASEVIQTGSTISGSISPEGTGMISTGSTPILL